MAHMPVPCGFYNFTQTVMLRHPTKDLFRLAAGCNENGRVSCSSFRFHYFDLLSCYFFRHINDFSDCKTNTIAQIENITGIACQQVFHCKDMCFRQIGHMDIISDAGTILCWIICTENRNMFSFPKGTCRIRGIRCVSGLCASPMFPLTWAPLALK